jgi:hypothetical protein
MRTSQTSMRTSQMSDSTKEYATRIKGGYENLANGYQELIDNLAVNAQSENSLNNTKEFNSTDNSHTLANTLCLNRVSKSPLYPLNTLKDIKEMRLNSTTELSNALYCTSSDVVGLQNELMSTQSLEKHV